MFLLLQSVVKLMKKKCREFLWCGAAKNKRIYLVAWANVFFPNAKGELNVKSC